MKYTFDKIKHIHALDGEPLNGTTTVIKNVMPPFLAKWGAQCAVDFLKENPGKYSEAVMAWSKVRKEKADIGTDMHSDLETYVKGCIENVNGVPTFYSTERTHVKEFSKWAMENVKRFIHSEVDVFSKDLWLGGQLDVVYEKLDGTFAIGDFKSNDKAYFNMFLQCAMYDVQQKENGFYLDTGEKVGEPLDISSYTIFAFGKGMTVHDYQANPKMFDGVRAVVTLNNLLPQ